MTNSPSIVIIITSIIIIIDIKSLFHSPTLSLPHRTRAALRRPQ